MTPILGIIASSQYVTKSSYESIATVTVGAGGSSTITFSSIPSTYSHLQIRGLWKNNTGTDDIAYVELTFNGSSSGYSYHNFRGDGSSISNGASGSLDRTYPALSLSSSGSGYTNIFGAGIIDILDYAKTNKYKTIRTLFGVDGSSNRIGFSSGSWQDTTGITSISLKDQNGGNFVQYTSIALYGIRGA